MPVDNYVKIMLSTLSADVCEIFSVIRSWFEIFYYCNGKVIENRSILFRKNLIDEKYVISDLMFNFKIACDTRVNFFN